MEEVEGYARPVNVGMTRGERKAVHRYANQTGRLERAVFLRAAVNGGLALPLDELRRLVLEDLEGRPDDPLEVIQLRVTTSTRERLDDTAATLGVSRYALVRACIRWAATQTTDQQFRRLGRDERDATAARRAASSAKGGSKGGPRRNTTHESQAATIKRLRNELGDRSL